MPEGDTIFRIAHRLRGLLVDQPIRSERWRERPPEGWRLSGAQVATVEARGKHLLLHLDDGRALHSHLGMTGSWHLYRPGEAWRKPTRRAALSFEIGSVVVVCFSPKTLEVLSPDGLRRHAHLRRLGPDLLGPEPSRNEILDRFRTQAAAPVGVAIMNQTVVSGVGNVYKSEVLFLCGVAPQTPVAQLNDQQVWKLVAEARRLMKRNVTGYPRQTRFAGERRRLWVYGRPGQPCYRCGTRIEMLRQGDLGRSTYWCPKCQQVGQAPACHRP